MYQKYKDQGLEMYFIIHQTPQFKPATLAYCNQVRTANGLTMPVLIDPDATIAQILDVSGPVVDTSLLLEYGARKLFQQQGADEAVIEALIVSELKQ
jgi:hypothetical protein